MSIYRLKKIIIKREFHLVGTGVSAILMTGGFKLKTMKKCIKKKIQFIGIPSVKYFELAAIWEERLKVAEYISQGRGW